MHSTANFYHLIMNNFKEIAEGYGFEEVPQEGDGIYCTGCYRVHKRPTKMYENAIKGRPGREVMCRDAIIRFYGE